MARFRENAERRRDQRPRIASVLLCSIPFVLLTGSESLAQAGAESLGPQTLELPSSLNLVVEYPSDGTAVPEVRGCGSYVAGWAGATRYDVILVMDTSDSTRDPSGADIDGDGRVGRAQIDRAGRFENSDPGDSILASEIAAAREFLHGFHPAHTRVGIVAFSGWPPRRLEWLFSRPPSAVTLQPLTLDHAAVSAALDRMESRVPEGRTDFAAGIDRALAEFESADRVPAPDLERERLVLFFTDGYPTLPFGSEAEADNIGAALEAAERAQEANARIYAFAIGPSALDSPMALVEMAERTGGEITPVRHPADLIDAVRHAGLGEPQISLRNATTGEDAFPFLVAPDGAFQGFVRLASGRNRLEIRAASEDAPAQVETLDLDVDPNASSPALPDYLISRRIALLERCLAILKLRTLEAERERAERLRKRLAVEIERERRQARDRSEAQRKRLQIDTEENELP